jgi:hypothetical protein
MLYTTPMLSVPSISTRKFSATPTLLGCSVVLTSRCFIVQTGRVKSDSGTTVPELARQSLE